VPRLRASRDANEWKDVELDTMIVGIGAFSGAGVEVDEVVVTRVALLNAAGR
jgi:hypothetical protein